MASDYGLGSGVPDLHVALLSPKRGGVWDKPGGWEENHQMPREEGIWGQGTSGKKTEVM